MPSNQGFTMSIKANNGNIIPLYPMTTPEQIINWNVGEVYGPYTITLPVNEWVENKQVQAMTGIFKSDIPFCTKVLSGTQEEMIEQDKAYSLLNNLIGIESGNNEVIFTCNQTPSIDFQVQISWTR